jgi:cation transport ATPase
MQEKVSLTVFNDQSTRDAVQILKDIGYPPVGEPVAVWGGEDSERTIAFLVQNTVET